jgi:hypothetical protein
MRVEFGDNMAVSGDLIDGKADVAGIQKARFMR